MDCEKFDQHVIDALYDELDELTHAALKRHVESCSRCSGIHAGLAATREVGVMPLVEAPDDLEAKILDAVAIAQKTVPFHKKLLRGLAWAGSHAMRPQLAMAALFCLVIGSSLLLLRARPGTLGPVRVTENGSPAAEAVAEAPTPAVAQAAPTATAAVPMEVAAATASPHAEGAKGEGKANADGPLDEAAKAKDSGADARAALAEAIAQRDASGCAAAVGKLDAVAVRFAGTQAASDAMWAQASCYKQMGDRAKAQQLFLALRSTGYRDRAQAELSDANANMNNAQNQVAARAAPRAAAPPSAAPAAPADAVADAERNRGGAGVPAGAKAAKRPAAPAAPKSKARPAPARFDAAYAP